VQIGEVRQMRVLQGSGSLLAELRASGLRTSNETVKWSNSIALLSSRRSGRLPARSA
jgi:hypothetical protein